ncbi:hypothetical protein PVK06_042370 [Gossypium arboreum]|uniref:Uncharacterized protein n=1 Tax=Gossypium arboreum TaxID=29729 RepID=A0ABR0MMG3_GOSAR|nr:hypothetical protein PVK06_042370 [Gossypium arboreum]
MGAYRTEGWDTERRGSDLQSGNQFEYHAFPQTLDELELEFKIEAMELGRIRDKEEDEENYKHRKNIFLECCVDFFPLAHPYRANLYTLRLSLFIESHTSFRLFMGFLWCGLNVRDKCGLNVRDECVRQLPFCGFALNLSGFLPVGKASALTMNVARVVKDWLLIAFSWSVIKDTVTPINLFGYGVAHFRVLLTITMPSYRL